jgi:hypothetical protein
LGATAAAQPLLLLGMRVRRFQTPLPQPPRNRQLLPQQGGSPHHPVGRQASVSPGSSA